MTSAARHPAAGQVGSTELPQRPEQQPADQPHPQQPPASWPPKAEPTVPAAATPTPARRARPWRAGVTHQLRRWSQASATFDVAVGVTYLLFALWLTKGLWPDPARRAIADNVNDQALNEWFLSHGVLFWTGDFSLVTDRLNAPDGVNLMSNASNIFYSITMAPVTVWWGAPVTFAVMMAVNLAATAAGWYLLLARTIRMSRAAALVGGVFAGFAPGMMSQSNSHIHMTAQWLVPAMVAVVIRLARVSASTSGRAISVAAATLGLLVSVQLFIGEEVLFLTALTLAIFSVAYAVLRRRWARQVALRFLAGLCLTAGAALVLLAYPLWVQFSGPQHTPNAPFEARFFYTDVATFFLFSPLSLASSPDLDVSHLATSSAELNAFLGLPLVIVVLGVLVWLRRSPEVSAIGITALVMALLSLGPTVTVSGQQTSLPGLYYLINDVPVVNAALPTRYALVLIPLTGVLLAYAMDAASRIRNTTRIVAAIVVIAVLLPTFPRPLVTTSREPVPEFISTEAWRECVPDGGVMLLVPAPTPRHPDLMRWPAAANAAFAIPEGFFIGPYAAGGRSSLGIYPRPTSQLLTGVAETGRAPAIDDGIRAQARADLDYWQADCVALAPVANEPAIRSTLEQLLGPGRLVADVWTWPIRR